jgi:hypothetical protein
MFSKKKQHFQLTFEQPSSTNRRSATNLIYCAIADAFIPTSEHGKASVRNSISIVTASRRISSIRSTLGLLIICSNNKQAKSVCKP